MLHAESAFDQRVAEVEPVVAAIPTLNERLVLQSEHVFWPGAFDQSDDDDASVVRPVHEFSEEPKVVAPDQEAVSFGPCEFALVVNAAPPEEVSFALAK